MKISLNKNIKDSNKNFSDFEEKKGEFLKLTYESFLTNDKKYDKEDVESYKNLLNIFTIIFTVVIYLPLLDKNLNEFIYGNFILIAPQNPYIEAIIFTIFFVMPIIIALFIPILFDSLCNCYKKTNFSASKDGILLKSKKSKISFKKENISRFCIDKEINRQDKIPPAIRMGNDNTKKIKLELIKVGDLKAIDEKSFCVILVCKKSVNLPIYGTPQKEFVLFTNLSEEDAKYLVNSMNYVIFGLR